MDYKTINDYPNYTIYEDGTVLNHITFNIMVPCASRERQLITLTKNKRSKLFDVARMLAVQFIFG